MRIIIVARKTAIVGGVSFVFCAALMLFFLLGTLGDAAVPVVEDEEWTPILQGFFDTRNACLLSGDMETMESLFLTGERNGRYAYENEVIRSRYLQNWSQKQGVRFLSIESTIVVKTIKQVGRGYAFYILASTEYRYAYTDEPRKVNLFRLGTYHSLDLIPAATRRGWVISREWYDDPLSGYANMDAVTEEMTDFIRSQSPRDLSGLSEARRSAVEYADTYCGAADDGSHGYKFNTQYTNYNALGGDCANYASQIYHEGGGFRKNSDWNFRGGRGSRSWVNAQGFKNYMLYSGRGSVIAKGTYQEVYRHAYELLPGDFIGYIEKGRVTHISVVTGLDSKGYPLVNSHNSDRYRAPWDLGWNGRGVSMYLIRMHY